MEIPPWISEGKLLAEEACDFMRGAREGKVIAMEGRPLTLQLAQSKVEVTRIAFVLNTILKFL